MIDIEKIKKSKTWKAWSLCRMKSDKERDRLSSLGIERRKATADDFDRL